MTAVPELPLVGATLERHGDRRADPAWVDARWADPRARVLVFAGDQVVVADDGAWWPTSRIGERGDADWVFLGTDTDARPHFAIARPDQVGDRRSVRDLGLADPYGPDIDSLVTALAVLNWHDRHPRCSRCGEPTVVSDAGWVRRCPDDDSQHFPRVDPAVIMLVRDPAERALLGRQTRWPVGWYSTLAGFVEPGETLEDAVVREVAEESGVVVGDVTYRGSQPWPFPSSLMLGFHATARTTDVTPDGGEIADARWFTRDELAAACESGSVRLPPRFSISRWLIELWFGSALPGDWSRS
ncbi:MAG: NAD(+) diphosphatase [Candidatus Nanopelagicales bacterium]